MPKENCQSSRHAEFLYFIAYFPLTLLLLLFLWPSLCFFLFFWFIANKTKRKANILSLHRERGGREGGRKRGRANTFVCKYEKFKAHTLSVLKHALIQTHTHTPTLTHTHVNIHTLAHTHFQTHTCRLLDVVFNSSYTFCCCLCCSVEGIHIFTPAEAATSIPMHIKCSMQTIHAHIQCFMATKLDFLYSKDR